VTAEEAASGGAQHAIVRRRMAEPRQPTVDVLRVACHLAAELPFIVLCLLQMAVGWRPTSDDAIFSWRAWNVLSRHPTLMGPVTHGSIGNSHVVFAPGAMLSWLLAVPVHLDPLHGALWGSALIGVVGAALAVEAGRAAAGHFGAVLCTVAVLGLAATQVGVLLNPVWTPWMGALWYLTTLGAAWATATGRMAWWPVVVLAASLSAQSHVVYVLPVVGLCLITPLVGLVFRHGTTLQRPRRRWIATGVAVGVIAWLPTFIQQLADRPGNLTLLWQTRQQKGGSIGFSLALRGLSSATSLIPSWMHRLPPIEASTFFTIDGLVFGGSAPWGVVAMVTLVAIGLLATALGWRSLAAAAWIAFAASVLTVFTVASIPSSDAGELSYLNVIYWPVGMMAWLVIGIGLIRLVRLAVKVAPSTLVRTTNAWLARTRSRRNVRRHCLVASSVLVMASAILVMVSTASLVPSNQSEFGGASGVRASAAAVAAVESLSLPGPFQLDIVGGPSPEFESLVQWDVAYVLFVSGKSPRLDSKLAPFVNPSLGPGASTTTKVVIVLGRGGHVTAYREQNHRD
jgi:hypothetical protein